MDQNGAVKLGKQVDEQGLKFPCQWDWTKKGQRGKTSIYSKDYDPGFTYLFCPKEINCAS